MGNEGGEGEGGEGNEGEVEGREGSGEWMDVDQEPGQPPPQMGLEVSNYIVAFGSLVAISTI